jgi:GNAT superfamily N-acetyltransferase
VEQPIFRRLHPVNGEDLLEWQRVFRGTQSFTFATEGRPPTDEDAMRMMRTLPDGRSQADVHIFAIYACGSLCGASFIMRAYPTPDVAYLVLLILIEAFQGQSLGSACLEHAEALAKSWRSSKLAAVVDSANIRALNFWRQEGFLEVQRRELPGLIGDAISLEKALSPNLSVERTA